MKQTTRVWVRGTGWLVLGTMLTLPTLAGVKARRIMDTDVPVVHQHDVCVKLDVSGVDQKHFGEKAAPVEVYGDALRAAILRSHVFTGICDKNQQGLELTVVVFNATWGATPGGWHVMGNVPVQWRLADPVTRRVLYQAKPTSTAAGDHGVGGAARINAGLEAAMRASILEGIYEISKLDIAAAR